MRVKILFSDMMVCLRILFRELQIPFGLFSDTKACLIILKANMAFLVL
jgi:hypothetical protein